MSEAPTPSVVEVVAGSPTPEELAAVLTVVSAVAGGDAPAERPRADRSPAGWGSYWRAVRREHRPGPGAWARALR